MSCRHNCPINTRPGKIPRHKLDQVRRRLDFSEEVSEAPAIAGPPADKYGHFKKLSERHSSHDVEPPMYANAQMAAVPDYLEFVPTARSTPKKAPTPPCYQQESVDADLPESFLEYCREREAAKNQQRARVPCKSVYESPPTIPAPPYYVYDQPQRDSMGFDPTAASTPKSANHGRGPPCRQGYEAPQQAPQYSSYLGYDLPGAECGGMMFDPTVMSTPKSPVIKPETPYHGPGYYPFPVMHYCPNKAPSFGMDNPNAARSSGFPAGGLGKFAYPSSRHTPTPPTPSFGMPHSQMRSPESTVSSGDFFDSSPKRSSRRSRNADYLRKQTSSSSVACGKSKLSDTVCSDDLLKSSSPCQKCPTLGVTPVHSSVSFSSSCGNLPDARQNISKSIENELIAREQQERNQLEADLTRWQQARRKLVMNTASMGS